MVEVFRYFDLVVYHSMNADVCCLGKVNVIRCDDDGGKRGQLFLTAMNKDVKRHRENWSQPQQHRCDRTERLFCRRQRPMPLVVVR